MKAALAIICLLAAGCSSVQSEIPNTGAEPTWVTVAVMEEDLSLADDAVQCLAHQGFNPSVRGSFPNGYIIIVPRREGNRASQALLSARSMHPKGYQWFLTPAESRRNCVDEMVTWPAFMNDEKVGEALEGLDRSIALCPGRSDLHWLRVLVLLAQGDVAGAFQQYDDIRDCPPERISAEWVTSTLSKIREDGWYR